MLSVHLHQRQWSLEAANMTSIPCALPLWETPQWRAIKCWQKIHVAIARDAAMKALFKGPTCFLLIWGWAPVLWGGWYLMDNLTLWEWLTLKEVTIPRQLSASSCAERQGSSLPPGPSRPCSEGLGKVTRQVNMGEWAAATGLGDLSCSLVAALANAMCLLQPHKPSLAFHF